MEFAGKSTIPIGYNIVFPRNITLVVNESVRERLKNNKNDFSELAQDLLLFSRL